MSKPFLTQQEKIFLRTAKNRGWKVYESQKKKIFGKDYVSPSQYRKNKTT